MPTGDKKELDRYRNQLLRRAEAVQRCLDEIARAAKEELVSIKDQIRALDSIREILEADGEAPANTLDRKSVTVKEKAKTVLIVEKRLSHSQSLVRQTLSAGFNPIVATTAEGGLKKAKDYHPDLILLDMELADMDGQRFVTEIRRNPDEDRIPIIAMSILPHLKARCHELGCDDFLLKPVRMMDCAPRTGEFSLRFEGGATGGFGFLNSHLVFLRG